MTENIIVALISGLVASISPILIFIATERSRKDKLRESQQASYKEATDAINKTLAAHRTDYLNGINDDLINIFIENSETNKYNKYDVWVSADVKYMITFTKTFAIASYRKNDFDYDMLPEPNEETVRYECWKLLLNKNMQARDIFSQIKDYIDAQNILDELEKFLDDDELLEFCNYLKDEYNIELYNDTEFFNEE